MPIGHGKKNRDQCYQHSRRLHNSHFDFAKQGDKNRPLDFANPPIGSTALPMICLSCSERQNFTSVTPFKYTTPRYKEPQSPSGGTRLHSSSSWVQAQATPHIVGSTLAMTMSSRRRSIAVYRGTHTCDRRRIHPRRAECPSVAPNPFLPPPSFVALDLPKSPNAALHVGYLRLTFSESLAFNLFVEATLMHVIGVIGSSSDASYPSGTI
ncbi:hypothetical protein EI94DRAFT_621950 [Lactarius quietus]|nr:hypothetical protein EI94DRAFT_721900 [Lactarius quietus]KAF8263134.1 hypothetical protein EI94DRAFT_621950 [Lactarius quietus]